MIPLKISQVSSSFSISKAKPLRFSLFQPLFLSLPPSSPSQGPNAPIKVKRSSFSSLPLLRSISLSLPTQNLPRVSEIEAPIFSFEDEEKEISPELDDLSPNGPVYQKTLQLVECSMFAALIGLVYFLSNSLAIEVG